MQATKDSVYMALRGRLAQAYPARTVTTDGVTRPAIIVAENDSTDKKRRQDDTFYVEWGEARVVSPGTSTLMAMTCTFWYMSAGTDANGGVDRGRVSGEMDSELMAIWAPPKTHKYDWTSGSPADLASNIFWSAMTIRAKDAEEGRAAHEASLTVYFYPEVNQP